MQKGRVRAIGFGDRVWLRVPGDGTIRQIKRLDDRGFAHQKSDGFPQITCCLLGQRGLIRERRNDTKAVLAGNVRCSQDRHQPVVIGPGPDVTKGEIRMEMRRPDRAHQ